jgi:ribose transport system substrate-binding protein
MLAAILVCLGSALPAGARSSKAGAAKVKPNLRYVRAQITKYKRIPRFSTPGPPINARSLSGKKVFSVAANSAVEFVANVFKGEEQAAKLAGANYRFCPTQGQISQWQQCISQAIGQRVNLLTLFLPVDLVAPQVTQARRAGIRVIQTGEDNQGKTPAGLDATADQNLALPGRLMADYAIDYRRGKANSVVLHTSQFTGDDILVKSLQAEVKKYCGPTCKVRFVDVPVADWATGVQTEMQSALTRDRGVNIAIAAYDGMASFAVAGIRAAGAAKRVKLITFNGTPSVISQIGRSPVIMDIGQPTYWIGWNDMDQAFRVLLGKRPGRHHGNPVRIFDASNVKSLGRKPGPASGYGKAYIAGYKKLWRITK